MALLLAQARNIPQAEPRPPRRAVEPDKWGGVELHGKTLGIVGLGRVGVLVAQRAHAFGMQLVAYDPYVSADRARQLGVELVPSIEELVERADFLCVHLPKTPETVGLISADVLEAREADAPARQHRPRRHRRRGRARRRDPRRAGSPAPRSTCSRPSRPPKSPLFELDSVVVTPHLGASTIEAQDKAGQTIAEQVVLALRGRVRAVRRQRRRDRGERQRPAVHAARRAARAAVHRARRRARRHARGQLRGRDRRLRLPGAHARGPEGRARARSSTSRCRS